MAPELEAPPPDERDGEGPWGTDNPDDLERVIHELEQPEPQAQLMQRLLRSHQGPLPSPESFWEYHRRRRHQHNRSQRDGDICARLTLAASRSGTPADRPRRMHRLARHGTRPRWPYRQRQISNRDTT